VALASQVVLGVGDAARNMDEMTSRYHDLLASNIPRPPLKLAVTALIMANRAYSAHSLAWEYQEMLINYLREASRRLGSQDVDVALQLAIYLACRSEETGSSDDYKEAMALFNKIITSEPNREPRGRRGRMWMYGRSLCRVKGWKTGWRWKYAVREGASAVAVAVGMGAGWRR